MGVLYLVPTPIGNPDDFTLRALETLRAVDIVAAEDTRDAARLLAHFDVKPRLVSYHEHNESGRASWLVEQLQAGRDVALVPDAGTPLVSDPGYRVVRAAIEAGIEVVPLPGASAAIAALVGSGLPPSAFSFAGFLPRGAGPRRAVLESIATRGETQVLYETPHRILDALGDAIEVLGDRSAALAWNLSKPGERFLRGTLTSIRAELAGWEYVHGEMTLVVEGAQEAVSPGDLARVDEAIELLLAAGVKPRVVRDALATATRLPRREVYERVLRSPRSSE
jgi:16S rRNA (cytidine1402-2'-O)-methyltransferase